MNKDTLYKIEKIPNKEILAKVLANLDMFAYKYSNKPDELRDYIAFVIYECDLEREFSRNVFGDERYTKQVREKAEKIHRIMLRKINAHEEIYA